jgi:hypothetical protein
MISLSSRAPGALGKAAAIAAGVTRWRTQAWWHARASGSSGSEAARSTSVRGTVVTGMARTTLTSRRSSWRTRCVTTPGTFLCPGDVTSGVGATPVISM